MAHFGANQWGNHVVMRRMVSPLTLKAESLAPRHPESFEHVSAKRLSFAPAQSAVLP